MILRGYQHDALAGIFKAWKEGKRSIILVMPTGTGKTVVFAALIRRCFPKRVMVVAHRQELIDQAADKISRLTGFRVEIEMGERRAQQSSDMFHKTAAPVVVASIQTLTAGGDGCGRMGKFDPMNFDYVIIDEVHHAPSDSYLKMIQYFSVNPNIKFLGVTATPNRTDDKALGKLFECVAFDYEIAEAIQDGYLVPIEQMFVTVGSIDFTNVRTTAGDLNGADVDAVMSSEKNLHPVANATMDAIRDGRRGLGFASSIHHAYVLANIMNRHRPGMAAAVSGKTDRVERAQIVSDFAKGKLQFMWNCGVFTEGFDDSGIQVVAMARPTKSTTLYMQMIGRGTRPHEDIAHSLNKINIDVMRRAHIAASKKPSCLVLDFVGNSGKHKLINSFDVLGGDYSYEAKQKAIQFTMRFGKPVRIVEKIREQEEEIAKIKQRQLDEEARKAKLVAKVTYSMRKVDPFDVLGITPEKLTKLNEQKALSQAQRRVLRQANFDPDSMDYAKGAQLVKIIMTRRRDGTCSIGQAQWLKKFNLSTEMSYDDAKAYLDAIAKNRWRGVPNGFVPPSKASKPPKEQPVPNEDPDWNV